MTPKRKKAVKTFHDPEAVDEAVKEAVRHALEEHKRLKHTVAGWDGHSVIVIPAESIPEAPPPEST